MQIHGYFKKNVPTLPSPQLQLHDHPLERVESYKYLGLLLTNNLSWSPHITNICSKAKQVLGLLYRRFYGYADDNTLKQLYLSLVRPHLDYACQIWDPHLAKDKVKLENVQKFACKLASHQWDTGYQELLELFELPTLEELCYFPETDSFLTLRSYCPKQNAHYLQLSLPFAHTNSYKYSFFPHSLYHWNSLDSNCVLATSYHSFMYHLRN